MIRLGVPSKGRLMELTFDWFAARGVTLSRSGSDRDYGGRVEGIDGLQLVLLSAGEIPRELAVGRIELGVTGQDLVRERLVGWRSDLAEIAPLGFGHADLILAVPECWRDCETLDDFASIARDFRAAHGFRLRIATKYHRLVRAWLAEAEVADYQLVDSQGATEGTVANQTAEAIADITSSGETLRANALKIIEHDNPILRSQAVLFANRAAMGAELDRVLTHLGLAAR
ncbi:ATP phosphoribosyltransferase [Paracoccus sp. TK19116]|uniref:ATP phosphoribosyltransferase n=1 Tax=Paracoccus albicereus TaxID=2922394 RepID=A0ABT1MXZ7_9RHOB|nr:ATP phosphoribosyltransferase [Paracoccus albicereus]MCQ0971746.1 ATP phosphoribosyltransferase [Paracoccus albicereus]